MANLQLFWDGQTRTDFYKAIQIPIRYCPNGITSTLDETAGGLTSWDFGPEQGCLQFVKPKLVTVQRGLQPVQRNLQRTCRHTLPRLPAHRCSLRQRRLRRGAVWAIL